MAVIGGSDAHVLLQKGWIEAVALGARDTPYGRSQPVFRARRDRAEFLFMPRHGEKGYGTAPSWVNYRANIYALKDLGVERIVAWSGPGAIKPAYAVGQFVVPHDVMDETRSRKGTFFENQGLGFIRQNPVFCQQLRATILETLTRLGAPEADGGV